MRAPLGSSSTPLPGSGPIIGLLASGVSASVVLRALGYPTPNDIELVGAQRRASLGHAVSASFIALGAGLLRTVQARARLTMIELEHEKALLGLTRFDAFPFRRGLRGLHQIIVDDHLPERGVDDGGAG